MGRWLQLVALTSVLGMLKKKWQRRNERLHPETDYVEIYRNLSACDFPWDYGQALSLALFRTYAVPSIGRLLDQTGQFTSNCQKRQDDTALLLEAPVAHGFDSEIGRAGVRRINQMHRMYDISNDDLRYVLATFVVVPKRWIDDFGWRKLTAGEIRAIVNYYRELGRRMAISDIPETYTAFEVLMDDYEAEHFAYDEGAKRVADSTLQLLSSFFPAPAAPLVDAFSRALMDPALIAAFGYDEPGEKIRRAARLALRARARVLAYAPSRRRHVLAVDNRRIRSYPHGYDVHDLGTFPPVGCPVSARSA